MPCTRTAAHVLTAAGDLDTKEGRFMFAVLAQMACRLCWAGSGISQLAAAAGHVEDGAPVSCQPMPSSRPAHAPAAVALPGLSPAG